MIVLRKKEKAKLYHMQLTLEKKGKDPPFLAVLMLARENGGQITSQAVRNKLMPSLPFRACENILFRLQEHEYLDSNFSLTDKGHKSAETRSYWEPERGAYEVSILDSDLVDKLTGQKNHSNYPPKRLQASSKKFL